MNEDIAKLDIKFKKIRELKTCAACQARSQGKEAGFCRNSWSLLRIL